MNPKALKTLEFNKILERLESHATCDPGRELCRALLPSTDIDVIGQAQEETHCASSRLLRKGNLSFGNVKDIRPSLKRLELGASLNQPELLTAAGFLENVARVKSYGKHDSSGESADCLDASFDSLISCPALSAEIRRCLLSETEVSDTASRELSNIRSSISRCEDRIHSSLNSFLNGSLKLYLQDNIVTMRDGHYCVPVKAEYKNSVQGIVHDQSSSNATYFIEPAAIVNLNNEIRELQVREAHEIEKILSDLSSEVYEHSGAIANDYEIMVHLDFVFAKGALANEMSANKPQFNNDKIIELRKARHPLIDPFKVVPTDIRLGEDFSQLVITGPNTGGKTVTLKTTGLLTLMGQAGLHIPALDGSRLSVFTQSFADIGDEQSIEQSLSTFSSHMKNVVEIINNADEDSLVLFDELGAGTDPTEGAALAIAILSHLHSQGIRTVATTHYSELKLFALSTEGIENASCEFNVETLKPTYRLIIGTPGKSNAFAISSSLGLPDYIIEAAKNEISSNDLSFEEVIINLEQSRTELEKEKEEVLRLKEQNQSINNRLTSQDAGLAQKRDRILNEANEEASRILREAKEYADRVIRELNKKHGAGADIKDLERERTALREKIDSLSGSKGKEPAVRSGRKLTAKDIRPGDDVRVISMNVKGTVETIPDAKGNVFVRMGIIRSKVHLSDLEAVSETPAAKQFEKFAAPQASAGSIRYSKSMSATSRIKLLGMTVDQAEAELDKFIDDALLAHLSSITIVHGKGTGALRNGVHAYLRSHPSVKSFHLAQPGEGDSGVTIAELQ